MCTRAWHFIESCVFLCALQPAEPYADCGWHHDAPDAPDWMASCIGTFPGALTGDFSLRVVCVLNFVLCVCVYVCVCYLRYGVVHDVGVVHCCMPCG